MGRFFLGLKVALGFIRCFPHILLFYFHRNRKHIQADTARWMELEEIKKSRIVGFVRLLSTFYPFRNVFYHRVGSFHILLNIVCRRVSTLIITTDANKIGDGFFIQHGFATAIGAESIGKNCWINQQVTIGSFEGKHNPTIGDNVRIYSGAVIIGNITIGNNAIIGANATVYRNIPDNTSVYAAAPKTMTWSKKQVSNDN